MNYIRILPIVVTYLTTKGYFSKISELLSPLVHKMNEMKVTKQICYTRKENLKKCTSFEEQKSTRYIRGNVYLGITVFSCLLSTNPYLRFLLICFARVIKGFYSRSLGNEVDLTDIMKIFPNILAKN